MQDNLENLVRALAANSTESECLEFKRSNTDPDRIGRDISALANSAALLAHAHAYKIWGIDDASHAIVGTNFDPKATFYGNQELELWLRQHLSDNANFTFDRTEIDGAAVVVLRIWPAQYRPVLWRGLAYVRTGTSTQELKHGSKREEELWRRTRAEVFELQYAAVGLSAETVMRRLNVTSYKRGFGLPDDASTAQMLHNFEREQIVVSNDDGTYAITNLGALMFANDLDDFPTVSRKALRVIKYEGASPISLSRSKTFTGGYAQLDEMLGYIEALLPQEERIEGAVRRTVCTFPPLAVRELCANMLIHQDFSITGTGPIINIFEGRIEFTNPGRSLVDLSRLINDPPHSRNERLAALARRLGLCEEAGSGWDKVVLSCEQALMPAPEVEEPGDNVRVILLQKTEFKNLTPQQRVDAAYWHACVQYVQRQPMTNGSLRKRFGLPASASSQVSRVIKECLERNVIKLADPDAGRRYARYVPIWA